MERACGGDHLFPAFSPAVILAAALGWGAPPGGRAQHPQSTPTARASGAGRRLRRLCACAWREVCRGPGSAHCAWPVWDSPPDGLRRCTPHASLAHLALNPDPRPPAGGTSRPRRSSTAAGSRLPATRRSFWKRLGWLAAAPTAGWARPALPRPPPAVARQPGSLAPLAPLSGQGRRQQGQQQGRSSRGRRAGSEAGSRGRQGWVSPQQRRRRQWRLRATTSRLTWRGRPLPGASALTGWQPPRRRPRPPRPPRAKRCGPQPRPRAAATVLRELCPQLRPRAAALPPRELCPLRRQQQRRWGVALMAAGPGAFSGSPWTLCGACRPQF